MKKRSLCLFVLLSLVFSFSFSVVLYAEDNSEKNFDEVEKSVQNNFGINESQLLETESLSSSTSLYEADLSNGIYVIKNQSSLQYIDIHGPSQESGALIHQWTYSPNITERWEVESYSDGTNVFYSIKSLYSDLYLGVTGMNRNTANVVQLDVSSPDNSTLWRIYKTDDNLYVMFPKAYEGYMNVLTSPSSSAGDELIQTEYYDSSTQYWYFYEQVDISSGNYYIQNAQTRRYADLYGPSSSAGTRIQQWDLNNSNESSISTWRKWIITKSSNYYSIKNAYSNKYLGVDTTTIPPTIKQYTSKTSDNTKWLFFEGAEGNLTMTPKGYDYEPYAFSMAVTMNQNSNGTPLVLYSYTKDSEYRDEWVLNDEYEYLGNITNWNSNRNFVNYIDKETISVKMETANVSYPSVAEQYLQTAIQKWDDVIPQSINRVYGLEYDVYAYIATTDQIRERFNVTNFHNYSGLTYNGSVIVAMVNYGNEIKYIRRIVNGSDFWSRSDLGYEEGGFTCCIAHEFGHSIGYGGHSLVHDHLMNSGVFSNYVISDAEKNHIQIPYNVLDLEWE